MRILLVLIFTLSLPARAAVCGLYQVEDFGDRIAYTLIQFGAVQTVFNITNPGSPVVKDMIRGVCYCADGNIQQDPEFVGDESYQLLEITNLVGAPFPGCEVTKNVTPATP